MRTVVIYLVIITILFLVALVSAIVFGNEDLIYIFAFWFLFAIGLLFASIRKDEK